MPFKNKGALLLDLAGRIAFASTYFCDLVGIEHDEVDGKSWFDFVFPQDIDSARDLFNKGKLPYGDRIRLRRLDGTAVWTDIHAAPMRERGGRIYAITATVTAANCNQ
jgi:PAS domain S-box-containing protein